MPTVAAGAGSFVLLRADGLRLLLPQEDVGAAEYLDGQPVPGGQPGRFEATAGASTRSVVALSAQLRPLDAFPRGRFVVTPLRAGGAELCCAWDEVRVLTDVALQARPLPPALRSRHGPIEAYVQHEGAVLLCTTAQRLLAYARAGE